MESRRKKLSGGFGEKSLFNKEKWLPLVYIPVKISQYCCTVMKKSVMKKYGRHTNSSPIIGTLAEESLVRKQAWFRHGCNAYNGKDSKSQPMSFWTEQDVLEYLRRYNLPIASVYGEIAEDKNGKLYTTGVERTGCMYCAYGFHSERGVTRFQRLQETHPKQYAYCMNGGQWTDNPDYVEDCSEYDGDWKNWNPKKIWVPSKEGLGLRTVFDMVNEVYGKDFYRYE